METYNSYKYIRLAHVQNNLYQSFGTETQRNLYLMTKYILPVHLFTCEKMNFEICFWKLYDLVDKKTIEQVFQEEINQYEKQFYLKNS